MRSKVSWGWSSSNLLMLAMLALAAADLSAPPARAIEPCCSITGIDARTGVVTAKEISTGRSFEFKVTDAALLKTLKVGQKITADLKAMTVTLPPARPGVKAVQLKIMKAEPVGAASAMSRPRAAAGGIGRSSPPVKVTPEDLRGDESQASACKAAGGEWRCTVVSTGSSPGPEDDTVSCHCIRNQ